MKNIILAFSMLLMLSSFTNNAQAQSNAQNTGIVLVQQFIPQLLSRLNLLRNDYTFVDDQAQSKCVHVLNYVATGSEITSVRGLEMFKLLCGVELDFNLAIQLSNRDKEVADSLIKAMIDYWNIGQVSIGGFRESWLNRGGMMKRSEDAWHLTVERRPFDLLLDKFPFLYTPIKFHWMPKPVYVTWR